MKDNLSTDNSSNPTNSMTKLGLNAFYTPVKLSEIPLASQRMLYPATKLIDNSVESEHKFKNDK